MGALLALGTGCRLRARPPNHLPPLREGGAAKRMNSNNGLALIPPRITPVLDPAFRPAVLANRAFRRQALALPNPVPARIALEQTQGNVSHFHTFVFPDNHPAAAGNFTYLERIIKFLLWSRGGFRIHFDGPAELAVKFATHYHQTPPGSFPSDPVSPPMFSP